MAINSVLDYFIQTVGYHLRGDGPLQRRRCKALLRLCPTELEQDGFFFFLGGDAWNKPQGGEECPTVKRHHLLLYVSAMQNKKVTTCKEYLECTGGPRVKRPMSDGELITADSWCP